MSKWLRRILKGLGILIGVLTVLVIGLVIYVQLAWSRPLSRPAPQMTAPSQAQEVPTSTLPGAAATGTGAARGEAIFDAYCPRATVSRGPVVRAPPSS